MSNVYEHCPVLENNSFKVRLLNEDDVDGLYKVYSDKNALPFFNNDNCSGDNFYFETKEIMLAVIKAWLDEYKKRGFVRFTIIDKLNNEPMGTIELFNRQANDYFNNCGLMRVDVRSDYEKEASLSDILNLITDPAFELFNCKMIATKAPAYAVERIAALKKCGYKKSDEKIIGFKGNTLGDYWTKRY